MRADVSCGRKSRLKPPGGVTLDLDDQFVGEKCQGISETPGEWNCVYFDFDRIDMEAVDV